MFFQMLLLLLIALAVGLNIKPYEVVASLFVDKTRCAKVVPSCNTCRCTAAFFAYSFYRASSYASAVLGVAILSVSVCPSLTRVFCDKTKQCTADILIPHERAITLVF